MPTQELSRLPVRIPEKLSVELIEEVVRTQKNLKGKSKWVCEAIEDILVAPDLRELVDFDDAIQTNLKAESFSIPVKVKDKIQGALIGLRKALPEKNVTTSSIVRAAIIRKLILHEE